jgi:hypothetical protein
MSDEMDESMSKLMMENMILQAETERRRMRGEFTEREKKLRAPLTREEIIACLERTPQAHTEPMIANTIARLRRDIEVDPSHMLLSCVTALASIADRLRGAAIHDAIMRPMEPFKVTFDAQPPRATIRLDYVDRDGNPRTAEGVGVATTEPDPQAITGVTITRVE